jgi:large subunit ribosomal protein L15
MARIGLHNLTPAENSRKKIKRIGRGQGSGHGGTSTRGHKGQGARAGAQTRPWFEGGQLPLIRRVPKFGFHSPFKVEYQVVNVSTLEELVANGKFANGAVTPETLLAAGAIAKKSVKVKILGNGDLKKKLAVSAHAFSGSAKQKIEAAGGTATVLASAAPKTA